MTRDPHATMFLERFGNLQGRLRRVHLATFVCHAALALVLGAAVIALCDYRWELALDVRRVLLAIVAIGSAAILARRVWKTMRRWSRPTTAAELEARFPELGQRVRTTLQYSPQSPETIRGDGVAPPLVQALAFETDARTQPLDFNIVVPSRRLLISAAGLVLTLLLLVLSYSANDPWRTALRRSLLTDIPYTTISVEPGNASVVEGSHLNVRLKLAGRTERIVLLLSRPRSEPEGAWNEEMLDSAAGSSDPATGLTLETRFARITEPLEYRVVALNSRGKPVAQSPPYQIAVRYPLAIRSVETTVAPPQYTGLGPKTFPDGSVTALRGSRATLRVTLDRAPATASLRRIMRGGKNDEPNAAETVAMTQQGAVLSTEFALDGDFDWSLVAASSDGTPLPENVFRVRVHEDRPPQVAFAEPADSLEVHSLAEVVMQTRVSDDYGVTRSGIVFQINSDEEHTLVEEDFAEAMAAVDEVAETGRVTPRTRAMLERILPLEHFALTQKDCVVYYAFAEDNLPGAAQRTETDLRFIDIRPFKTIYQLLDPSENEPGGEQGRRIASLEELIRRQRYALNRTIRLQKIPERWADSELNTIDRLIDYENELAQGTRELAQFLEDRGSDVADVLFQAEAAMLGAVDSLSIGRYDTAVLQEKDAQQRLVEARDKLAVALMRNRGLAAALRAADQRLVQKLRRTRDEEEERRRERVVERLIQLAMRQAGVAQSLAAMPSAGNAGAEPQASQTPEPKPGEAGEPSDAEKPKQPAEPSDAMPPGATEPKTDESSSAAADPTDMPTSGSNLEELQDRQAEIALEATDLAGILQNLEGATELAKERMKQAAETTNTASTDLNRNDMPAATAGTQAAADQLRELARQVAGLLASETSQQVAIARDVAADLTFRERDLASELESTMPPATPGAEPRGKSQETKPMSGAESEPVDEAGRLVEATRTLQDVMKAIADTTNSTSAEAVDRVTEMISRGDIKATLERLERVPGMLANREPPRQAVLEVRDAADRMEATARSLDRLYRSIVMPRIEQLRELERRVTEQQRQMMQLPSMADARQWERGAGELMEQLEQEGIGGAAREEIQELLAGRGTARDGTAGTWATVSNGFLVPSPQYVTRFRTLVENIQQHMQEILLADLQSAGDEATPPAYRLLVERYLQVLAKEAKSR